MDRYNLSIRPTTVALYLVYIFITKHGEYISLLNEELNTRSQQLRLKNLLLHKNFKPYATWLFSTDISEEEYMGIVRAINNENKLRYVKDVEGTFIILDRANRVISLMDEGHISIYINDKEVIYKETNIGDLFHIITRLLDRPFKLCYRRDRYEDYRFTYYTNITEKEALALAYVVNCKYDELRNISQAIKTDREKAIDDLALEFCAQQ